MSNIKELNQTPKISLVNEGGTVFTINFDFTTSAEQLDILGQLQQGGFSLYGYKGAKGADQISSGLPTWFKVPFIEVFGQTQIDYEPLYKVYVFNKATIGANTVIRMEALSDEFPLGTALQFNKDGTFSRTGEATPGTISVLNNRPGTTSNVTIGLAAKVNGRYNPFCAFTSTPQSTTSMEPQENVCLFAAKANIASGSVIANTAAPGCKFNFSAASVNYFLEMISGTLGITNVPDTLNVTETNSNQSIAQLLG